MHNLKELKIWHKAMEVVTQVLRLTSQIRRSAVSIPSNIAEGAGRNSNKEFVHFLGISNGSSYELQTQLLLCKNFNLVDSQIDPLLDKIDQIQKMNYSLQ